MNPCNACPRRCNVDRSRELGWCKMDDRIHISSIVIHRGEEPPISGEKGIVNVFFPSCNMQCIYCQNWQISCRGTQGTVMTLDEVCDAIIKLLPYSENNLGFVSPTHFVTQMVMVVEEIRRRGYNPTIIYNTNGYDLPETLKTLDGIVDVWLPDFKYSDDSLAEALSQTPDYSKYALAALKEMAHQVGTSLLTDERGVACRGIIIRHLILPGFIKNSKGVFKIIAKEISPNLHLSIMSQYYPPDNINRISPLEIAGSRQREKLAKGLSDQKSINHTPLTPHYLNCPITKKEYQAIIETFHSMGLIHGWLQDFESNTTYRPNFSHEKPFKD